MTHNEVLVSIITPCYNSESYLSRYLDSILNQTYKNIQQIIINDGSFDKTEEIVFDYIKRFDAANMKITYLKQENQGLGAAISAGLKLVEGKYFSWCDSDNFYSSDYVESKVVFLESHPDYSIVRCNGYVVDETNIEVPLSTMDKDNIVDKTEENLFLNCLYTKNFHFGCAMLKTDDFDKVVNERSIFPSRYGQNWQLLLPMFYYYKSGYIDKPMFYFVVRRDSVSNCVKYQDYRKKIDMYEGYNEIIKNTLINMNIPDLQEHLKNIRIKYYNLELSVLFSAKNKKEFKKTYKKLKRLGGTSNGSKDLYYQLFYPLIYRINKKIKYEINNFLDKAM